MISFLAFNNFLKGFWDLQMGLAKIHKVDLDDEFSDLPMKSF